MLAATSIFLDFHLPNATTWFYFSLLLAVALFFKFSRLLSVRNWDVLALFLLVPGLLLRQEATSPIPAAEIGKLPAPTAEPEPPRPLPPPAVWWAYLWLLGASGYFLVRCLADLALVRQPAVSPNLNLAGLAWLGSALFICLAAVALRRLVEVLGAHGGSPDWVAIVWARGSMVIACHLAVIAALVWIGHRHFQDAHAGMAAATFYLLAPYTAAFFDQVHQVLPMALVLWAIAVHTLPTLAGFLLGLAAGSLYFPALLFPAWVSFYWRRGHGRFAAAFLLAAALGIGTTALILGLGGPLADELRSTLNVFDLQQWKLPSTEGFWTGVHWAYRIPVFTVYFAFLVLTVFWPMPKNLAHLLALSAALMIGTQFWFADRGGLYILWYLPLLLLLSFRPNLSDRQPPLINPETDWLRHFGARLRRWLRRPAKVPEPVAN
jgi:hypothetical protein